LYHETNAASENGVSVCVIVGLLGAVAVASAL
jgi:hypothetical protein